MNARPSANPLFRRLTLAGYGAAAAAGAVTVGLIAGVAHTSQASAGTNTNATTGSSTNRSDDDGGYSDDSGTTNNGTTNNGGVVAPAPQNAPAQGGSHGS